jgi:hypothetical protein
MSVGYTLHIESCSRDEKSMQGRAVFLFAVFVLSSPCASSADATGSAQQPTQQQDAQRRNAALLDHAEKMAERNEALMTRAEAQATRAEAEAKRMDAVLAKWEQQSRGVDAALLRSNGSAQALIPEWRSLVPWAFSLFALFVALKSYRRKSGVLVRGSFTTTASIDCSDKYVSMVTLENVKDRAITIFGLYLRVGYSYYIELERLEKKPLLLKAYESYQVTYGPTSAYSTNGKRLDFNRLLSDLRVPLHLVLSTSEGKCVVDPIRHWNPVIEFFGNHMTAVVHIARRTFKNLDVGDRIRYIIELFDDNEQTQVLLIRQDDLNKFASFKLTPESLETAETLWKYLNEQVEKGTFPRQRFTVHDANVLRQHERLDYSSQRFEAKLYGFFAHHIVGRLATRRAQIKMKKENEQRKKQLNA